jgi:hypothetical protein
MIDIFWNIFVEAEAWSYFLSGMWANRNYSNVKI